MLLLRRRRNILNLKNCTFIDPFDDANVQAGQGTVAYEILEEAKKESIAFDAVLVPVGWGRPHRRSIHLYQGTSAGNRGYWN